MKKNITELTNEELKIVFESNEILRQEVEDDMEDSEMYWINQYLKCFKSSLSNWSIGFYNRNFITIKDGAEYEFLQNILEAQRSFCFIDDKFTEIIDNIITKYDRLDELRYEEGKQNEYNDLEAETEEEFENIKKEVLNQFNRMTDFNTEDYLNYFIEFYVESRLGENAYIDENFILYEDISYVKSYK